MLPAGDTSRQHRRCIIPHALYHKLKTQSSAPKDGRNYRPKHVELIEIINKLLLLHLVGCLYHCISDARSHKHQIYKTENPSPTFSFAPESVGVIFGNCVDVIVEVTRRRGRRRKKLLVDLKDRRGYCQLKEEALDRAVWRNRFGRGFGPVV